MLICRGAVLCGAEGVISTYSCLKAWQIDRCLLSRQIWCWWIYPQSFSPCIRADMATAEQSFSSLLSPIYCALKTTFSLGTRLRYLNYFWCLKYIKCFKITKKSLLHHHFILCVDIACFIICISSFRHEPEQVKFKINTNTHHSHVLNIFLTVIKCALLTEGIWLDTRWLSCPSMFDIISVGSSG